MKKVIVIVGPTGIGKSALAVKLAKHFKAEIINGDSVSLYQELNIGSAKIKEEEMDGVVHHLVDFYDVNKQYTVSNFQKDAREIIEKIDLAFIVGGTGLYINAALNDYNFEASSRDGEFAIKYENYSNEELYNELISVDPDVKNIHMNNRNRVLRALELALNGNHISKNTNKLTKIYDSYIIYLDMPRELLYDRINKRVEIMFQDGLEKEVRDLFDKNITINAIGYKEFIPYFLKEIDLETVKDNIKKNSRHLAKKQITWFRNQTKAVFYDVNENCFDKIVKDVEKFLGEEN